MSRSRLVAAFLFASVLALIGIPALARAAPGNSASKVSTAPVAKPTVEGPVSGGKDTISLVGPSADPLTENGYVADEYFFGGTATAYEKAKPLGTDGRWKFEESRTAPYTSRMVVYRPEDPEDFSGTVYVEWLNVTAGFETPAVYGLVHNQVVREGAAWIGVSAQAGGVQGTDAIVDIAGAPPGGLRVTDPARYGALTHPGDLYSFDIFSQAGVAAAGDAKGVKPLGDLKTKRVIATGKSQAAFRLVSYVNGVQPIAGVYDGFLISSRHRSGAPLGPTSFGLPDDTVPETAIIRTDSDVPVIVVQTETDLEQFQSTRARQPDSRRFRLWEVAGSAHADTYAGPIGFTDTGDGAAEKTILDPSAANGGPLGCAVPINSGPTFAVMSAALSHLDDWVRDGTAPPRAPRIKATPSKSTGSDAPQIVRDEHGNAVGGIRTPLVDVPLATLTGKPNAGSSLCFLFGATTPFDAATLATLYPTHADYVRKFDASAGAAVKAGFWLKPESESFKAAAKQLSIGA
ncbi:MAG: hypothetical protein MUP97_05095 [Acidimicrobiia bacterium]|nr:hypothetical protein [Acidimicrobiia bacterium]